MGNESNVTVGPAPVNGGWSPGTVVQFCITYNNWNLNNGTNWCEGFDITLGSGWIANTITPITYPNNNGGGGGQWIFVNNSFNGNPGSAGGAGNNFGPGFFFDLNMNGVSQDDWGDMGTGPWTICFSVTVSNNIGLPLSVNVSPVSDGFAGSWATNGCNGFYQSQLSPGTTVTGCNNLPILVQLSVTDATCNGFLDGGFNFGVNGGTPPYTFNVDGNPSLMPYNGIGTGLYQVVCIDDNNCQSTPIVVQVDENTPVINNIVNQQNILCNGDLTGSFTINSVNGVSPYTYTLGPISNNTGQFSGIGSGIWNVTIEDANGCLSNINVNITEPTILTNNLPITTNVDCFGNNNGEISINANGGIGPYTYDIISESNNTGLFQNLGPGIYTINITDQNGCILQIPNIQIIGPNLPLSNFFTPTQPQCFGYLNGQIQSNINGGTPPYNITWNTTPVQNTPISTGLSMGNYQINIIDDNGCILVDNFTLDQPVDITLSGQNTTTICQEEDILLEVTQNGAITPFSINWSNSQNVQIYNNTTTLYPNITTVYTATIVDVNGCTENHNYVVNVNPLPSVQFSESDNTGCSPFCIEFTVDSPSPSTLYTWNFNDGSTSNATSLQHCFDKPGVYSVSLDGLTNLGCTDNLLKTDLVIINQSPLARFLVKPSSISDIQDPNFEFENISENSDSFFWNLGDGFTSNLFELEHKYQLIGDYCVKLIANNQFLTGIPVCIDSTEICVKVNPLSVLYIPNSFSPNFDGVNDIFLARGSMVSDFEITIFNRWGEQIYRSFDIDNGWIGSYGEQICPDGIYVYIATWRNLDRVVQYTTGTITLIR
jgi:gliding motility-associated-like protein